MFVTGSVADQTWLDKYLPGDESESDPRWVREEIVKDTFMWVWRPATIELINGVFVPAVRTRIERCPDLEAAEWWAAEIMDVQPVISAAALAAPAPRRIIPEGLLMAASMIAAFVCTLLPLVVL